MASWFHVVKGQRSGKFGFCGIKSLSKLIIRHRDFVTLENAGTMLSNLTPLQYGATSAGRTRKRSPDCKFCKRIVYELNLTSKSKLADWVYCLGNSYRGKVFPMMEILAKKGAQTRKILLAAALSNQSVTGSSIINEKTSGI